MKIKKWKDRRYFFFFSEKTTPHPVNRLSDYELTVLLFLHLACKHAEAL
jgi:hypothetical protein